MLFMFTFILSWTQITIEWAVSNISYETAVALIEFETGSLKCPKMLAGHASGCWLSALGAGVPYKREKNESLVCTPPPVQD